MSNNKLLSKVVRVFKKKKKLVGIISFILVMGVIAPIYINSQKAMTLPRLVAHAGGDIYGIALTNSLEAINSSVEEGNQLIEMDFNYSTDGTPICIHDWGNVNWLMNIEKSTEPMSIKQFSSTPCILDLHLLTLEALQDWLVKHPSVYIVTDIKDNSIGLLKTIKESFPEMYKQIIPQIYSFEEYDLAYKLGYKKIILTLYLVNAADQEILDFCKEHKLLAVTMDQVHGESALPRMLSEIDIPSYVHTINSYSEYKNLRNNGVYGVYTDYFEPNKWVEKE